MNGFIFKYENILKMRSDHEEDKKNILGKLNSELSQLEFDLEEALANKQHAIKEFENMLLQGCKGSDLQFIQKSNSFHEENIKRINYKIKNKKLEINDAYEEYIDAVKERKIMEKLKEK
jgi:flagellar FliJ protein